MVQSLLTQFPVRASGPGVVKNVPGYMIPDNAFQDTLNVRFLRGMIQKVPGWIEFSSETLDGAVTNIDQFFLSSGSDYLIVTTDEKMYKWNTSTVSFDDITGSAPTGTFLNLASTEVAFDLFIYTNNLDSIKKWDGSAGTYDVLGGLTDVEQLDGTPPIVVTTAGCVRYFNEFLVLMDLTENGDRKPFRVRWSRPGLPENWKNDTFGNGQAGAADIGTVDFILTGERLGNSLVIYKERSIWLMTYIGVPTIFDFRQVISGLGLIGPKAVGNFGDEHLIVCNDDIYFFNGDSVESIGLPVRKYFFDLANPKYIYMTTIFIAEEDNEALIAFASTDSDDGTFDKALVYNYLEKHWSIRELSNVTAMGYYRRTADLAWQDDEGTWDNPTFPGTWDNRVFLENSPTNLIGDSSGKVYTMEGGSKAGAALELSATSKMFDFGTPDRYKRIEKVQLVVKKGGDYNVTLKIGYSENLDDDVTYKTYTYNLSDTTNPFVYVDVYGRFFTFQISVGGANQDIALAGMNIYYILRGQR